MCAYVSVLHVCVCGLEHGNPTRPDGPQVGSGRARPPQRVKALELALEVTLLDVPGDTRVNANAIGYLSYRASEPLVFFRESSCELQ